MFGFVLYTNLFYVFASPIDNWNKFSHPYTKKDFGKWELILLPRHDKSPAVDHNTKLKVDNRTSSYLFSRPR